jgi:hypothetical protein
VYAVMASAEVAALPPMTTRPPPPVTLPALRALRGAAAAPLAGLRAGIVWAWFEDGDADVVEACRAAVERLQSAGLLARSHARRTLMPGARALPSPAARLWAGCRQTLTRIWSDPCRWKASRSLSWSSCGRRTRAPSPLRCVQPSAVRRSAPHRPPPSLLRSAPSRQPGLCAPRRAPPGSPNALGR